MTERFVTAYLVDTSHKLPIPGTRRLFSPDGETIDRFDPFWIALLHDKSITLDAPKKADAPTENADSEAPRADSETPKADS